MSGLNESIIVAVRCASQKYADIKLELSLKWTGLDLKRHLNEVHPFKPEISRQKLIYAGQLMKDGVTVSEYLKRLPDTDLPVIHFVYTPDINDPVSIQYQSNDGVRQRKTQGSTATGTAGSAAAALPQVQAATAFPHAQNLLYTNSLNNFLNYYGGNAAGANMPESPQPFTAIPWAQSSPDLTTNPGVAAGSYASASMQNIMHSHINPLQGYYFNQYYQYLQQIYGQGYGFQWAPYGHHLITNPQGAMVRQTTPHQPAEQPLLQQPIDPALNHNNGGLLNENNNDEAVGDLAGAGGLIGGALGGRDFLDLFYMVLRSSILFALVFAYSSIERTAFVMFISFLFFAYQNGWFARRGPRAAQNEGAQLAPPPQPAVEGPQEVNNDNDNNNNRIGAGEGDNMAAAVGHQNQGEQPQEGQNAGQPQEQSDSAWHVFWSTCYTFISSFFASLVPERPPVNF